ncbi:helix-turn-helix domain-containing protein [Alkalilimnicola sp. S0819]|uniref:helix-turn-helix domain-containing protein n=1 Tax=Alkalilimnicola sp. S0819 TaxID=2613922 RepID=UPI001261920B|nr:helix-turn-helix transcriptional regulator [Alkalilimnicola sp. S0819]KAB7624358.1 helix-turn-helix transcriptional regulator [Alkalilimnicola sp. S0819]MPQ16184.1 hypothetical protein [Alkalilimnicola sp. S0819]
MEVVRPMERVGERLRAAREALGYAQKGIAEAAGSKLRSWQDYEAGKKTPGSQVIAGLVSLGINANWILKGTGPMLLTGAGIETTQNQSGSGFDAELDAVEAQLADLDVPIDAAGADSSLRALRDRLHEIATAPSAQDRQKARAELMLKIAFADQAASTAVSERRKGLGARMRQVDADLDAAIESVGVELDPMIREGLKTVMYAHGLTTDGAVVFLEFLRASQTK